MGATVIRIVGEGAHGDPMQQYCEPFFKHLIEGQELRTINLKSPAGMAEVLQLLEGTDIFLTSSRPSALQRLGLDWETLHSRFPQLIHVAIVGYSGEKRDLAGHDLTYEAHAGTLATVLDPTNGSLRPALPVVPIADVLGAERAVSAGLAALVQRARTATGSYQEISLEAAAEAGATPARFGLSGPGTILGGAFPPYDLYQAQDGNWVAVAALEPHFLAAIAQFLDYGTPVPDGGVPTREQFTHAIAQRSAQEWDALAQEHDLPLAHVRLAEAASNQK